MKLKFTSRKHNANYMTKKSFILQKVIANLKFISLFNIFRSDIKFKQFETWWEIYPLLLFITD